MKIKTIIIFLTTFTAFASFKLTNKRDLTTKYPLISKSKFKRIAKTFEKEFMDFSNEKNEDLLVYADWNDPSADMALARRWETAQILIFRGLAHRREIDPDALMLILCHELGHLYGGYPLKRESDEIAAEGQADYFATKYCIKRALLLIDNKNINQRIRNAIHSVGNFLANNWGHQLPSLKTPSTIIQDQTIMDHPTPQCRFDTFFAGLTDQERPRCWFKE
ncbi:MAG: hypothetical protein CME69_02765 [Halobacteriovorax sp.]|nr:hypothetical protein [Halobacteriovorax sp.]